MSETDELTVEKLRSVIGSFKPLPQMPRWKDLTWAQRNMVEREIDATENAVIRGAMREAYYCEDDNCRWHRAATACAEGGEEGSCSST